MFRFIMDLKKINKFIIPISLIIVIVVFSFNIDKVNKSPVLNSECIVLHEGDSGKVNVVFLSYGYDDQKTFLADVDKYINGTDSFSSIEPYSSNFNKLNFYAVVSDEVKCHIDDGTILCDDRAAKKVASKCHNDYIFIINKVNQFKDIVLPLRSSAYLNIGSINVADNKLVVLHEFGHLFGGLSDEYVEDGMSIDITNSLNCDISNCNKWNNVDGTGCFNGCSKAEYYRSIQNGIMRNYYKSNVFGIWNERILSEKLT